MSLHKTTKRSAKFNINKTRKLHQVNSYAGKAIGAGGFGCIFKPHLKCKNNKHIKNHLQDNYVSKLMLTKYVTKEMNLIKEVEKNVNKIPNYKSFF